MNETKAVYILVKVEVEVISTLEEDEEDIARLVGNECEYNVTLVHDKVKIVNTELAWSGDDWPS